MEESTQPTVKSVSIKWGAINGLLGIIYFLVVDFTGQTGQTWTQWAGLLIFVTVLVFAHKEFKEEGNGYMSYGQGLGIGTLAALISSVISNIFFLVYVSFINSSFIDSIKEKQITDMQDRGMSDAEIDQAMSFSEPFMTPVGMAIMGAVIGIFFAFLAALIVTAITKKTDPQEI